MKLVKRTLSVMLAAAVAAGTGITAVQAEDGYATRGEVCQMLLAAADDYNPTVQKSDILKGYDDGSLHEERGVTRAEAVVMLARAFGELPELKGYNAYLAIPKESFTDIPAWANDEINSVLDAGIIAGKDDGIFAPDDNVTTDEMNLWIQRVYALFGTNLKDNFFTAVNHDYLENLKFSEGQFGAGKIYDVDEEVQAECLELIKKAAQSDAAANTPEGKIKILYNNIMDKASRNKDGIAPVKPYLDKLDSVKNIDDIVDFCLYLYRETASGGFFGFVLTEDAKDSNVYLTEFNTVSAPLPKEAYIGEADYLKTAYMNYIKAMFTLAGDSEADAERNAQTVWDIDSVLSGAALKPEEYYDVSKTYNIYSLQQLDEIYKTVDLQKVFDEYGYKNKDKISVTDVGVMEKTAELMTDENVENLKTYLRCALLTGSAVCLGSDFEDAGERFSEEAYGITGRMADDLKAANLVSSFLSIYIDMLYKDAYYSQETADNVTKIINDAIEVYKDKISKLDWMSGTTKEKALKKLETMGCKVAAPESWNDCMEDIELRSYADGGSLFENLIQIKKAADKEMHSKEGTAVDKSEWVCPSFTVNAFYNPVSNDITIPLGYLKEPMYGNDYSYEEMIGGVGSVICHELSHAFDTSGAQFDEKGNASDWWTEEDKAEFDRLCQKVVAFYDGREGAPGIAESGEQTLIENIADLGAMSCMTDIAARIPDFDYKKMYEAYARMWAMVYRRETTAMLAMTDTHSILSLRVNPVLQSSDKFYEVYGITEGDGMWIAPEDRARIW